jgi:hypothetical protein
MPSKRTPDQVFSVRGHSLPFDFHNGSRHFLHLLFRHVRYRLRQFGAHLWEGL